MIYIQFILIELKRMNEMEICYFKDNVVWGMRRRARYPPKWGI